MLHLMTINEKKQYLMELMISVDALLSIFFIIKGAKWHLFLIL